MRKFISAGAFIGLTFTVIIFWMRGSMLSAGQKSEYFENSTPDKVQQDTIRVLTWNISFAQGSGSDGSSYTPLSREEMTNRLDRMASIIREAQADIVLLQEVDFSSDRSYRVDQLAYLARKTGIGNFAQSVSWTNRYVPYPYWPFSNHWGKMYSGAGVLSRFPILGNASHLYKKPHENLLLYNWFYPYRYRQVVQLEINSIPYRVINNHLEAFHFRSRMEQADSLRAFVSTSSGPSIIVFGGDMNSLPTTDFKRAAFATNPLDDYSSDSTLAILNSIPSFSEAVSDSLYLADRSKWLTFPAHQPERRLDYLFIHNNFRIISSQVIQTGELSDHLPVVTTITFHK